MKRKLLSILLCLAMALSLLPTAALADETTGAGTITVGEETYSSFSEAVNEAEPDENGVYTIPEVNEDTTLYVFLSVEEEQSNMFASLIVFVHDILEWFKNFFESLFGAFN